MASQWIFTSNPRSHGYALHDARSFFGVVTLSTKGSCKFKQVNKDGVIPNQAELDFQQDNRARTIELKTQRSLCYAAGQEPGNQHQPPLILQDFVQEYASIDPQIAKSCQISCKKCPGHKKTSKRTSTMDRRALQIERGSPKTTEHSGLTLGQACALRCWHPCDWRITNDKCLGTFLP